MREARRMRPNPRSGHAQRMQLVLGPGAGDWLLAIPLIPLLRMGPSQLSTAAAFRLGLPLPVPRRCDCRFRTTFPDDHLPNHLMRCEKGKGRTATHHALRDEIANIGAEAGFTAHKETHVYSLVENLKADVTIRHPLTGEVWMCDVTLTDPVSYQDENCNRAPGWAARAAAAKKEEKYARRNAWVGFHALAVETYGYPSPGVMAYLRQCAELAAKLRFNAAPTSYEATKLLTEYRQRWSEPGQREALGLRRCVREPAPLPHAPAALPLPKRSLPVRQRSPDRGCYRRAQGHSADRDDLQIQPTVDVAGTARSKQNPSGAQETPSPASLEIAAESVARGIALAANAYFDPRAQQDVAEEGGAGGSDGALEIAGRPLRYEEDRAAQENGVRIFGVAIAGGIEAAIHNARTYLEEFPGATAPQIDLANAFNAVKRAAVFEGLKGTALDFLVPLVRLSYIRPSALYLDHEFGAKPLQSTRGVRQGNPLGPMLFTASIHSCLVATEAAHPEVVLLAYVDDITVLGEAANCTAAFTQLTELLLYETVAMPATAHPLFTDPVSHQDEQARKAPGWAARMQADKKESKYAGRSAWVGFYAMAVETYGYPSPGVLDFLRSCAELAGKRRFNAAMKSREVAKLLTEYRQRWSVTLQRAQANALRDKTHEALTADVLGLQGLFTPWSWFAAVAWLCVVVALPWCISAYTTGAARARGIMQQRATTSATTAALAAIGTSPRLPIPAAQRGPIDALRASCLPCARADARTTPPANVSDLPERPARTPARTRPCTRHALPKRA
ncbi:unnamed protein product [Closterium sp. NIES-54]